MLATNIHVLSMRNKGHIHVYTIHLSFMVADIRKVLGHALGSMKISKQIIFWTMEQKLLKESERGLTLSMTGLFCISFCSWCSAGDAEALVGLYITYKVFFPMGN